MNNAGAIYLQHRNVIFSVQMWLKFVRTGKKITVSLKGHYCMLTALFFLFDTGLWEGEKSLKTYSAFAGLIALTYYFWRRWKTQTCKKWSQKEKKGFNEQWGKENMGGSLVHKHQLITLHFEVFNSLIWRGLAPALYFGFSFLFVCFSLPKANLDCRWLLWKQSSMQVW